jgi:hydrogenase maturation protein HypF
MVENGFTGDTPVIGVAFDGTGYGLDDNIWGGEFFIADYQNFNRIAHFKYIPLPGGDSAIKSPARMALAALWGLNIDWDNQILPVKHLGDNEKIILKYQLTQGINVHKTSSVGRLFDITASLLGVRHQVNYEAQAAIELESLVDHNIFEGYEYVLGPLSSHLPIEIDMSCALEGVISDVQQNVPVSVISARFHNTIIGVVLDVVMAMRKTTGINNVCLSGGVWQNITLLTNTCNKLKNNNFSVFTHHKVPTNDGGISLGQAVIASHNSPI